ncbi:hypothetical protein F4678DRAFT_426725 [Xylaria arbuscula]|nr:hypothetical protein F4678DRAFT_426725 [Xylaria arbuscula]
MSSSGFSAERIKLLGWLWNLMSTQGDAIKGREMSRCALDLGWDWVRIVIVSCVLDAGGRVLDLTTLYYCWCYGIVLHSCSVA